MQVYTAHGMPLTLVEPPLGKGAEGAVHQVAGFPGRVAKVYLADPQSRAGKIEAMASMSEQVRALPQLAHVAWPLAPLYADAAATHFVGFGMARERLAGSLGLLYEYPPDPRFDLPLSRKLELLEELCRTVETFHAMGQVIGDFNTNNIQLTADMHVAVMDVDSFHARIGGTTYRCEVCMSGFMAPELIRATRGTTFKDCAGPTFTPETDRFALAVHIFRTLCNGVHPYHCIALPGPDGSIPAPLPIEKRVERGQTPYFTTVLRVKRAPFAPKVEDALPPYLRKLFERAFVAGQKAPEKRPTAAEWEAALAQLRGELACCHATAHHEHWAGAKHCPYCEADKRAGVAVTKAIAPARAVRPTAFAKGAVAAAARAKPDWLDALGGHARLALYWVGTVLGALLLGALACTAGGIFHKVVTAVFDGSHPRWTDLVVLGSALAGSVGYGLLEVGLDPDEATGENAFLALFGALASMAGTAIVALAVVLTLALLSWAWTSWPKWLLFGVGVVAICSVVDWLEE